MRCSEFASKLLREFCQPWPGQTSQVAIDAGSEECSTLEAQGRAGASHFKVIECDFFERIPEPLDQGGVVQPRFRDFRAGYRGDAHCMSKHCANKGGMRR